MDAAQLQQLIDQINAGLAPLAQPHPAGAFALTPGQANPNLPLDYTTSSGIKIWNEATAPLPFKFNVEGKDVNAFCEKLLERAEKSGWNLAGSNVINIPDSNQQNRNLIEEYGRLTTDEIRAHAETYVALETRQSQNNMQLYYCISSSLSKEGQLKILAEQSKYHVGAGNDRRPSGALLFKLLMQKAVIDTRATASFLRENLSSLDTYMSTIKSDIEEFNKYVKMNWEGLKARGERCDDLMINLFKGYQNASDREFVRYIKQKRDAYDDGDDITVETLMTLALNKYETLTKQDLWNAKTAEQEQIVALTAELGKIKDVNLKLAQSLKSGSGKSNKSNSNTTGKGKSRNSQGKGKGKQNDKWAWKKVAPKSNESKTKRFNDRTYHWCGAHQAWTEHPENECKLKKKLEAEQQEDNSDNADNSRQANTASYVNALNAIVSDLQQE